MRLPDIVPRGIASFAVKWRIPKGITPSVYHSRAEVWTPARLLGRDNWRYPAYCHIATPWDRTNPPGALRVIDRCPTPNQRRRLFISYSWNDSPWVKSFAEELRRRNIAFQIDMWELRPGDDLQAFISRLATSDVVLPVCSDHYVDKTIFIDVRSGTKRVRSCQFEYQIHPGTPEQPYGSSTTLSSEYVGRRSSS
jgi:TIR domain-containing protein